MKLAKLVRFGGGADARRRKQAAKKRRRIEHFDDATRWTKDGDIVKRNYSSYAEYVDHQATKLSGVAAQLGRNEKRDLADFNNRFQSLVTLREARTVLCLGARLGTEVEALIGLGYFAVGIDLNPGADNPYVLRGDFHKIVFADGSVDAVYTNALDHVFDLDKVLGEVRRLLRPGGLFVVDLIFGYDEGHIPGEFEATYWRDSREIITKLMTVGGFELVETRELQTTRQARWRQGVLRRPLPT
jgi:SAM-dependent methyltransferase